MKAVSSHHDIKMRVLVLSAIVACALAAPSGELVAPTLIQPTVYAAGENIDDLKAALIDAKVKIDDAIGSAGDKNREVVELAVQDHNEKVIQANDLAKERSLEAFWAGEDKKWQAIDGLKTAEAQLEGQLASIPGASKIISAPILIPQVHSYGAVYPAYVQHGLIAPLIKFQEKPEEKEEKPAEKLEETKEDTIAVEAVKSEQPVEADTSYVVGEKLEEAGKYVVGKSQLLAAPLALSPFKLAPHWVAGGAIVSPGLKTIAVPYPGHVVAPTFIKTVW